MVTLTTPTRRNPESRVMDPEAAEVAVISPAEIAEMPIAEETAGVFAPVHGDNLLVTMLRSALAFYDWMSGPPMTKRERIRRAIAEATPGRDWDRLVI